MHNFSAAVAHRDSISIWVPHMQHFIFLQGAITHDTLGALMPANGHTNGCRICVCILDKSRVNKRVFRHLTTISCLTVF